ncbi:MAG TPA: hypothetical protein PKD52_03200 [Clostridiales bacterium]|nr:hypothetical protein [Clostridiales bacterium]
MQCEKLAACPFYNEKMPIDSGLGAMYRKKYCENDRESCARFMVSSAVGKDYVTNSLYPNMVEQAKQIIAEQSVKK